MTTQQIYKLIDPRDNLVKYVGRSRCALTRFRQHVSYTKYCDDYESHERGVKVYRWIAELQTIGLRPKMEIIETVPHIMGKEKEDYWIKFYTDTGELKNTVMYVYGKEEFSIEKFTWEYIRKIDQLREPLKLSRIEFLQSLIDNAC